MAIENQELVEFLMEEIKRQAVEISMEERRYGKLNTKYQILIKAIRDHQGITSEERKEISDALDEGCYWEAKIK